LERVRAEAARRSALPFEVRQVGEMLRRYGLASATGDRAGAAFQLEELRRAVKAALRTGARDRLLELRAVQAELFVEALSRWEATGLRSGELTELGGPFLDRAKAHAWVLEPRALVLAKEERAALFRIRWVELTGLRELHPFRPSLNEWRVYYRFLLEHDESSPGDSPDKSIVRQLSYIAALEKRDSAFPAALARGVLFYRLGADAAAADAFRVHLTEHPTGAWRLRAQNYLAAALERGAAAP
jgi:hypothetical protein